MRDSEVFKSGGVVLEGFELVLQSRYLNQSDISTRCVVCVCVCAHVCMLCHGRLFGCDKQNIREETGGLTQAFRALIIYFRKRILETSLSWQTTTCYLLWEIMTCQKNSEKKERRKNNWASLHRRNKAFLGIYRGMKMGKGRYEVGETGAWPSPEWV